MGGAARLTARAVSEAVAAGALEMHYQPVVALDSGHVVGFEALARIRTAEGLLPPSAFVPAVEVDERVLGFGRAVLRRSIAAAARWRSGSGLISAATLSVNVAPPQLEEPGFVELVTGLLDEFGVPPSGVILEITETSVTSPRVRPVLERLAAVGVRVALDDFGVGFATLDNLRRLPVQVLKLDRSFVAGVNRAGADRAIVRVIVDLAETLGLSVIAEGVETEEQAATLRLLGCPSAQGYLFAEAGPDPEAAAAPVAERRARGHGGRPGERPGQDAWPVETDTVLLATARLLCAGADPHRGTVHAVATALARRGGHPAGVTRAVRRLALVHDLSRLGLDGALPPALAEDRRIGALAGLPGPLPAEVALVRAAVVVADAAASAGPPPRPVLGAALAAAGEAGLAQGEPWEGEPLADTLRALAADPPEVLPVTEVLEDLERRRFGRRITVERLRSLVGVTRVLASSRDSRELLRVALEEVRRIVGAASASLERWERDTARLRTLVNVGQLAPQEVTFPDDETYALAQYAQARRTMLTGLPYIHTVDDPDADPEAIELLASLHKYSSAALPVYLHGRIWGQVWLSTDVGEPPFTAGDVETLMSVATLMGGVVAQAERLDDPIRRDTEDPLTRVGSRRAAEATLERLAAGGTEVTLLLFDVDRLKRINDDEGHGRGDEVLIELAEVLSAELPAFAGGSVHRLGGDDFCLLLPACPPARARAVVERVRNRMTRLPGRPTVSAGVAVSAPGRDLLEAARTALTATRPPTPTPPHPRGA